MTSKPVAFLLADLGITKSLSRPYVSNDNPYSEAQFKTMKYRPDFPERFGCSEDSRSFCQNFFGTYGFEDRYYAEREGVNSRLDPVQAAVLRIKLTRLPEYVRLRQEIAASYDGLLSPKIDRVAPRIGIEHARHLYVIRLPNRDAVQAQLHERGVQTGIHYPFPIHLMRAYAFLGYQPGSLPVTEQLATEILSLPLYPELEDEQIARVCTEINALVES